MDKQYAIFDMDGTLIDSMPFWDRLLKEYLDQLRISEEDREYLLHRTRRMSLSEAAAAVQRELRLDRSTQQMENEMGDLMDAHYMTDIPLKPGIVSYLKRLREMRVRLCVATLTPTSLAKLCLERLDIAQYFDFLISCEDMGVSKEQPDIFLQCALELGANPHDTAVYEDSYRAIRAARRAGFYTVGVYDRSSAHHWEELCLICDETIQDWNEAAEQF